MPVPRPTRYPQVAATPGGNFAEPASGVQLAGWPTGAIFPSSDANWLFRQLTDWGRSLDASRLASTDILATSLASVVSTTNLTILTGGGSTLTAVFTSGGVYYGNGERLDLTDAPTVYTGGSALVFPASSSRYVIARPQPSTGGVVNGSSCAELAISAVTPVAGWTTLLFVTTDATTIVSATSWAVSGFLEWGRTPHFGVGMRATTGVFSDEVTAPRAVLTGYGAGLASLQVESYGGTTAARITGNGVGTGLLVNHPGSGSGIYSDASTGTGNAVYARGNAFSPAIRVEGGNSSSVVHITTPFGTTGATVEGGTYAAVYATGVLGGVGVIGNGGVLGATGVIGYGTSGLPGVEGYGNGAGPGVVGGGGSSGVGGSFTGGAGATSHGVLTVPGNTAAYGVRAESHASATSSGRGAYVQGKNLAPAVEAVSAASYAAILTGKTSAPTLGTVLLTQQTTYPSTVVNGAVSYASWAVGELPHLVVGSTTDSTYRGIHSSIGGYTRGHSWGNLASNASQFTYVTLATITLSGGNIPKVAGRSILFRVSMRLRASVAGTAGFADFQIINVQEGIAYSYAKDVGTGQFNAWRVPAVTTNWDTCVSFEQSEPIGLSARTFQLQFKRSDPSTAYTLVADGGFAIEGLY